MREEVRMKREELRGDVRLSAVFFPLPSSFELLSSTN
jgi:hypothetical protein